MHTEYEKKVKILISFCMLFVLVSSGCGFRSLGEGKLIKRMLSAENKLSSESDDYDSFWDRDIAEFIQIINKRDKETLKRHFSEYVQKNDKELDQEIESLYKAYPGPTDSWKWVDAGTKSISTAVEENREYITCTVLLKSKGKNYYLYFEYTTVDMNNNGRFGICCVDFTTPEVQAAFSDGRDDLITYKGKYSWEGEDRYKLHVTTEHKGDYQTRRIKGNEMIYTPTETKYSSQDFVDYVMKTNSVQGLRAKFGTENAGWKKTQKMFYKVTDGDDLYVYIDYMDGADDQVIYRIDLVDEEKDRETIFCKE